MSKSLDYKSTGTLIDELYTAQMKVAAGNIAAKARAHTLSRIIAQRTMGLSTQTLVDIMLELKAVLRQCWDAQETVCTTPIQNYSGTLSDDTLYDNIYSVAKAAKVAQETNAARNKLIRKIDELLGEDGITQLGKTYG